MATLKYVGKKSDCIGKTLWEILGNLKDFGVGRIIIRNSQSAKYKEPCFMKVLEVRAQPNEVPPKFQVFRPANDLRDKDRPRQVHVVCEYVFRGVKLDEPTLIKGQSSLPDFSLIPKHLEKNYTISKTSSELMQQRVLPRYMEFPPLLNDILIKNGAQEPKLSVVLRETQNSHYRVAKEGEKPTTGYRNGFGEPASPNLYKDVNYDI